MNIREEIAEWVANYKDIAERHALAETSEESADYLIGLIRERIKGTLLSDEELDIRLLTSDEMEECVEQAKIGIDPKDKEADTIYQLNLQMLTGIKSANKVSQAQLDAVIKEMEK